MREVTFFENVRKKLYFHLYDLNIAKFFKRIQFEKMSFTECYIAELFTRKIKCSIFYFSK